MLPHGRWIAYVDMEINFRLGQLLCCFLVAGFAGVDCGRCRHLEVVLVAADTDEYAALLLRVSDDMEDSLVTAAVDTDDAPVLLFRTPFMPPLPCHLKATMRANNSKSMKRIRRGEALAGKKYHRFLDPTN